MPASSIDGLNSGLNTTEIINSIMEFERKPAVLLEVQAVEKTNIVSAYKALQAKVLALKTQIDKLSRNATFQQASIKASDDSVVNATAIGKVGTGTYDLQVQSLARNHQVASQGFASQAEALLGGGTITIQVGDGSAKTITIDSSNNSLTGLQKAINDADIGVSANIINDGSTNNPYRLILAAEKTGVANRMQITTDLTGGLTPDFENASFDTPE
ncbi:hypothetical protein GF377_04260, partial [candidate division GN15 bacterium]|nr:hypothetical protein [candidate division GN15 bacterium]